MTMTSPSCAQEEEVSEKDGGKKEDEIAEEGTTSTSSSNLENCEGADEGNKSSPVSDNDKTDLENGGASAGSGGNENEQSANGDEDQQPQPEVADEPIQQEDEKEEEMEDLDEEECQSVLSQSDNGVMASPSVKTIVSTSDPESESEAEASSESRSVGPSPAKRPRNENGMSGLERYRELRRTKEPFLQTKSCEKILERKKNSSRIGKCMDCTGTIRRRGKEAPICRFLKFRKLRYAKNGLGGMNEAGFADATTDEELGEQLEYWTPVDLPTKINFDLAKFLLQEVGDQFCDLVKQEQETLGMLKDQINHNIIWRRVVKDLRELCDVCSTTLFNFHWTCGKCGFAVCISCFKSRKSNEPVPERCSGTSGTKKDEYGWPKCHRNKQEEHVAQELYATEIIPGKTLHQLWVIAHQFSKRLNLPQGCGCDPEDAAFASDPDLNKWPWPRPTKIDEKIVSDAPNEDVPKINDTIEGSLAINSASVTSAASSETKDESEEEENELMDMMIGPDKGSNGDAEKANILEDVSPTVEESKEDKAEKGDSEEDEDDLMDLMVANTNECSSNDKAKVGQTSSDIPSAGEVSKANKESDEAETSEEDEDELMGLMIGGSDFDSNKPPESEKVILEEVGQPKKDADATCVVSSKDVELKNFIRKGGKSLYVLKVVPKRILTSSERKRLYPDVPHAWLCSGFLLRLMDPANPENLKVFQEQWKRGQPVIVSNVADGLNQDLWSPASFSRDFGSKPNPLINCMTGKVVQNKRMKEFWDGFEYMNKRLVDENGDPMLLKLKDWPPGEDFAKICDKRFKDLMNALPLGQYTQRDGVLNLAARLPDVFSRPDLGPKMYIAYGSGLHLDKGTTNLHLDISDAVNVIVYVGVVKDADLTEHNNAVRKAIEESDCDNATVNRVLKGKELPGALWHIWEAKDADKIRDMVNKIALERGLKVERHHDAIHDQSVYLDRELRKRLMEEYNVRGYPILQCSGDAVFIPAGAPHQVRNLNNCIKIAEDFVSPENVGHSFYLTEEFRNLTETHTNHEDKLQIKNIVYHTVKDAVAVINESLNSVQE